MKLFKSFYIKVMLHVILGLFLGGIIALIYVTSTDGFKKYLEKKISQQFEQDFGLQLVCNVDDVDLLTCSVSISNISITPLTSGAFVEQEKNQWSIIAEKMLVRGSWLSLITKRALTLHMHLDHVVMMELFETKPEKLADFFVKIFSKISTTWLIYESVFIKNGLLYCKRTVDGLYAHIPYACQLQSNADSVKIQLYLKDGVAWYHQGAGLEKISASCVFDVPFENSLNLLHADVSATYDIYKNDLKIPGFASGTMRCGQAQISIKTEDGVVVVDPINIKCKQNSCWCDMSVQADSNVLKYFYESVLLSDLQGKIVTNFKFDLYNFWSSLLVTVSLEDLLYKTKSVFPGGKFIIKEHDQTRASGILQIHEKDLFKIDLQSLDGEKRLHAQNYGRLKWPSMFGWMIENDGLVIDVERDTKGNISGSYKITVQNIILKQQKIAQGTFAWRDGLLNIAGKADNFTWEGIISIGSEIVFKNFQIYDKGQVVLDVSSDEEQNNYITSSIDFSLVQKIVPESLKKSFTQDGAFVVRGFIKDGTLYGNIQTHYAHIRLPYVYNVISNMSMSCELDFVQKSLVLHDIVIDLHEGAMHCQRATFWFNNQLELSFVHAPVILDKIMMSLHKGIYSLVSGRLFLHKLQQDQSLNLEGQLFLHKTQIHENILSSEFHEMIMQMSDSSSQSVAQDIINLDIGLMVFDGLEIKTSFMDARAMIDVHLQGTVQKPKISGGIQFVNGQLQFPFKPIDIVSGKILFVPDQPLDPIIELTARGKLKKYLVTMQAWGTALDPHIKFQSQPYLNEEQILSLLILGVEDQSLSLMVPAFLTQKLQEIIFGPALSRTKLKSIFDVILKSMKYVRFLPQFTSQADRGGMRGIFEIDASENLHARLDTNFLQIEDTKADIDYDFTDDIKLRLQKDVPSTYGGEVEFRWKFS
ncbi:translocation/assembly module TamB domain-containing protein [Candidatus Dependentiae bacterium]|nr:translocation/assembly module TamB domain-containing protein [Candidatus Dependentiae bacterium]